jgi:diguanylate cyclase (GGDEF)-like protein
VLKDVSAIIKESLRRELDLAFRLGGDEFALLLIFPVKNEDEDFIVKYVQTLEETINTSLLEYDAGISTGISYSSESFSKEKMIEHADQAMYGKKNNKRRTACN